MNKAAIYEQIADKVIQLPLSTFRGKLSAMRFVKDIIKMYEEEKMKQNMMDKPL